MRTYRARKNINGDRSMNTKEINFEILDAQFERLQQLYRDEAVQDSRLEEKIYLILKYEGDKTRAELEATINEAQSTIHNTLVRLEREGYAERYSSENQTPGKTQVKWRALL